MFPNNGKSILCNGYVTFCTWRALHMPAAVWFQTEHSIIRLFCAIFFGCDKMEKPFQIEISRHLHGRRANRTPYWPWLSLSTQLLSRSNTLLSLVRLIYPSDAGARDRARAPIVRLQATLLLAITTVNKQLANHPCQGDKHRHFKVRTGTFRTKRRGDTITMLKIECISCMVGPEWVSEL